jgi:acyl-CoA synthetase (NDP forming)
LVETQADSERAYDAGFKQSGVIRANSIESLFDYSIAFAYQPLLRGNGIAVVTTAGGIGVMATDAVERAEELGVPLILAKEDTLSATEIIQQYFGKVRLHQPRKVERFDFARLYADLQLETK